MKFIKVTSIEEEELYINTKLIVGFGEDPEDTGYTIITMQGGSPFYITETPKEICKLVQNKGGN
jgi:hypothetical protein